MTGACFNIFGAKIRIRATAPEFDWILNQLQEDFRTFFEPEGDSSFDIAFTFLPESRAGRIRIRAPFLFRTRMCRAHGFGPVRVCDYGAHGKVRSVSRRRIGLCTRRLIFVGPASPAAYEIAWTALLSSIGEELDRRGLHRVHALGVLGPEGAALLPLPSRGGKSSLATLLLSDARFRIYSDEIPLVSRDGLIHPFPIRIALFPEVAAKLGLDPGSLRRFPRISYPEKVLLPIPEEKVAPKARAETLYYTPHAFSRLRFVISFVLGLGTPQMAEFLLRLDALPSLAQIALSRLSVSIRLLAQCRWKRVVPAHTSSEIALTQLL